MKPKIKYRLEIWGTTVVMQILEMDERFRSDGTKKTFSSALDVSSNACICLHREAVFLRGISSLMDNLVDWIRFTTKPVAESYAQKVHDSLLDWATNWEGFADDYKAKDPVDVLEEYCAEERPNTIIDRPSMIRECITLLKQNKPAPKPTLHQDGSIFTIA